MNGHVVLISNCHVWGRRKCLNEKLKAFLGRLGVIWFYTNRNRNKSRVCTIYIYIYNIHTCWLLIFQFQMTMWLCPSLAIHRRFLQCDSTTTTIIFSFLHPLLYPVGIPLWVHAIASSLLAYLITLSFNMPTSSNFVFSGIAFLQKHYIFACSCVHASFTWGKSLMFVHMKQMLINSAYYSDMNYKRLIWSDMNL